MSIRFFTALAVSVILGTTCRLLSAEDSTPETTTVALTIAVAKSASAENRELATSLLSLLEAEVSQGGRLSVVERQQIDLVLHELALSVDLSKFGSASSSMQTCY